VPREEVGLMMAGAHGPSPDEARDRGESRSEREGAA
jgi:hypothetical protein